MNDTLITLVCIALGWIGGWYHAGRQWRRSGSDVARLNKEFKALQTPPPKPRDPDEPNPALLVRHP